MKSSMSIASLSRFQCCHRKAAGCDCAVLPLPVAPAAHYLSGGIVADLDGQTTVPGLYAAGESSCPGLHGAHRLASNSLRCLLATSDAAD